jgi:hypothetical protein
MMRRPKGGNCPMASHSTYGWKNYGDTYALWEREFPELNQSLFNDMG